MMSRLHMSGVVLLDVCVRCLHGICVLNLFKTVRNVSGRSFQNFPTALRWKRGQLYSSSDNLSPALFNFCPLYSVLPCSSLTSAEVGQINPRLSMTAFESWGTISGKFVILSKMWSINESKAADERLSTPLCYAVILSSTSLGDRFSPWGGMPVNASCTRN